MVLFRYAKWIYAAAGSGVAVGIFNYIQSDKKCAQTSWTSSIYFEPTGKWDFNWDCRDLSSMVELARNENDPGEQNRINQERENRKSASFRHLILVRHGQYHDSQKDDKDRRLTELGKTQANYVGRQLKQLDKNYAKLTYSTMTRARETSEIILKYFPNLSTETDDMLREGSPFPPEPPSVSWTPEREYFTDGARIEAAFRKYFYRADPEQKAPTYDIIVCHANVIRYFLCRALQIPPGRWLRFTLHHCSITWIVICPNGKVIVKAVGDFGFMPKDVMSTR